MKKLVVLVACLGLILFAGNAGALTIDFDYTGAFSYSDANSGLLDANEYAGLGFTFNGFGLMSQKRFQNNSGDPAWYASENSFPSPDFAVFNDGGESVSIDAVGPFELESIWLAALGVGTEEYIGTPDSLTITGCAGETVYTKTLTTGVDLFINDFTQITFGWENITKLTFVVTNDKKDSAGKGWFLMDTFNDCPPEPPPQIPEPSILLLLGAGLLGIGFARRRLT